MANVGQHGVGDVRYRDGRHDLERRRNPKQRFDFGELLERGGVFRA
jgi:hypothetical protein